MCNLYTVRKTAAEVAEYFRVPNPIQSNAGPEVYPGTPGTVIIENDGVREMRSMTWGFPLRLKGMKPDAKPKPVNNIADLTKPMWVGLARREEWRCLIPMTGFAEAEGVKGSMTRTWFSVKSEPVFAWGGLWRVSDEWGPVYSGAMTDANEAVAPVHSRMPVVLYPHEYDRWMHGSLSDLIALQQRKYPAQSILMERTNDLWVAKRQVVSEEPTLL
ncbi:SOS response-associated peptidase [Rhizobium leguminosarum]